jgi:AraC-like DNA-binding protein
MEYVKRLQRTINYIEQHLEDDVSLADLATVACYSRSHFIWLFECATGLSPMEYLRKRRLSKAATAIEFGASIMDTALRFRFSSQDVFTRSFHNEFGLPPGMYRKFEGRHAEPQKEIRLHERGETMKLKHLVASYAGGARLAIEKFLDDDVKNTVSTVALSPQRASEIDMRILNELVEMRVLAQERGYARLATAVFLESDMHLIRETVQSLSNELSTTVKREGIELRDAPPEHRCYVAGILGLGRSLTGALVGEGANEWKDRQGKYGHARVDFDELCDAYDQYGPDLLLINTNRGERYSAVVIGPSKSTLFGYLLDWRLEAHSEEAHAFATSLTTYLTDAFALHAAGRLESSALGIAAAAAHLWEEGARSRSWIAPSQAQSYIEPAARIAAAVEKIGRKAAPRVADLLKKTTSGRQGVAAAELTVNFVRYVRKQTAKNLYKDGYFSDQIPSAGAVAVFYENECSAIDVMR